MTSIENSNQITVIVTGPVGCGKSALAGKIEQVCRDMDLSVNWSGGAQEENLTGGDWEEQVKKLAPSVVIAEQNTSALPKMHILAKDVPFSVASDNVKKGFIIFRKGWNGKGMFVYHVPAAAYPAQTGVAKRHFGENALVPYSAYLAIKNVDGVVSPWVPSTTDGLADDWCVADTTNV